MQARSTEALGLSLVLMVIVALAGCVSEDEACPAVSGVYLATYQFQSGDCPPIAAQPVEFDTGRRGVKTSTLVRAQDNVTTEIVDKGCRVRMTQTITDKEGYIRAVTDGDMDVLNKTEIAGLVSHIQYANDGSRACTGMFMAQFTKGGISAGGAATSQGGTTPIGGAASN